MLKAKHYILTSITLGIIAATSAGIIGLTNFLTKDRIAKNEKQRIKDGIAFIFGDNVEINGEFSINNNKYDLLTYGYSVKNDESGLNKYAIRTYGYNSYGKVSLIVGVSEKDTHDYIFMGVSVVSNEQSYASTLEEGYIDVLNKDTEHYEDVDVHCGATYGATLVKNMIDMTVSYANEVLRGE